MDYRTHISEAREQIAALDGSLNSERTPYLKAKLRFAMHSLDDAELAVRHAESNPDQAAMWHSLAELSIRQATQIGDAVHDTLGKYGGPQSLVEVGG